MYQKSVKSNTYSTINKSYYQYTWCPHLFGAFITDEWDHSLRFCCHGTFINEDLSGTDGFRQAWRGWLCTSAQYDVMSFQLIFAGIFEKLSVSIDKMQSNQFKNQSNQTVKSFTLQNTTQHFFLCIIFELVYIQNVNLRFHLLSSEWCFSSKGFFYALVKVYDISCMRIWGLPNALMQSHVPKTIQNQTK